MPRTNYLVIDVATAPLPDADQYLDVPRPPSNWKDQAKIDAYVAEKTAERLASAALDLDLNRITGIGHTDHDRVHVMLCKHEDEERAVLRILAELCRDKWTTLVTFNGLSFDLPLVMRRARYLGVSFPALNVDRYRSPHVDLLALLSDRDPSRRRSLGFYARRLGWTDLVKPLDGAEEARVHETGDWAGLEASLRHDVEACRRLAVWLGVMEPVEKELAIF